MNKHLDQTTFRHSDGRILTVWGQFPKFAADQDFCDYVVHQASHAVNDYHWWKGNPANNTVNPDDTADVPEKFETMLRNIQVTVGPDNDFSITGTVQHPGLEQFYPKNTEAPTGLHQRTTDTSHPADAPATGSFRNNARLYQEGEPTMPMLDVHRISDEAIARRMAYKATPHRNPTDAEFDEAINFVKRFRIAEEYVRTEPKIECASGDAKHTEDSPEKNSESEFRWEDTGMTPYEELALYEFQDSVDGIYIHMAELLRAKRQAYGPSNLLEDGMIGVTARIGDKLARVRQMSKSDSDKAADGESMTDALRDIIGYCTLALIHRENRDF